MGPPRAQGPGSNSGLQGFRVTSRCVTCNSRAMNLKNRGHNPKSRGAHAHLHGQEGFKAETLNSRVLVLWLDDKGPSVICCKAYFRFVRVINCLYLG